MERPKDENYRSEPEGSLAYLFALEKFCDFQETEINRLKEEKMNDWHSVEDRPLYTKDEHGNLVCTEDGDGEFIAAVPYNDGKRPNEDLWWIRHCVVEDEVGLCVVGDDDNEPAGWSLEDITHWRQMPSPPYCSKAEQQ